ARAEAMGRGGGRARLRLRDRARGARRGLPRRRRRGPVFPRPSLRARDLPPEPPVRGRDLWRRPRRPALDARGVFAAAGRGGGRPALARPRPGRESAGRPAPPPRRRPPNARARPAYGRRTSHRGALGFGNGYTNGGRSRLEYDDAAPRGKPSPARLTTG